MDIMQASPYYILSGLFNSTRRKKENLLPFKKKRKKFQPNPFNSHPIGTVKGRQRDELRKGVDDRKTNECKKSPRNA